MKKNETLNLRETLARKGNQMTDAEQLMYQRLSSVIHTGSITQQPTEDEEIENE